MKKLTLKRILDPQHGYKALCIGHRFEDSDSRTYVRKNFVYNVEFSEEKNPKIEPPQIQIKKMMDTRRKIEKFNFQVRGCFYMNLKRDLVKVSFHHTLNIKIIWKINDFSPQKSEALTK